MNSQFNDDKMFNEFRPVFYNEEDEDPQLKASSERDHRHPSHSHAAAATAAAAHRHPSHSHNSHSGHRHPSHSHAAHRRPSTHLSAAGVDAGVDGSDHQNDATVPQMDMASISVGGSGASVTDPVVAAAAAAASVAASTDGPQDSDIRPVDPHGDNVADSHPATASNPSLALALTSGATANPGSSDSSTLQDFLIKKKLRLNNKSPKYIRKQRSRSLPIINYSSKLSSKNLIPPLPPINLTSLKEIDLNEILKNPQLRHDILFDPQLQFRPNLDGERGKRKKSIIDKYWYEIYKECYQFFNPTSANPKIIRLPILFQTLKDILISLIPIKDRSLINEVLDIELIIQQLNHKNFDFLSLSRFLNKIFKNHCAPMRDDLVNTMLIKFELSFEKNNCDYLMDGLKLIFQILESMKLDIANHQIRLLRPILIDTAVDFEKDYFNQLVKHEKISLQDSINWYQRNYNDNSSSEKLEVAGPLQDLKLKLNLIYCVFDLLSCKKMINEFPNSLTFDHTRLILLRADIRQLIVLKLCIILFKNMVMDNNLNKSLINDDNLSKLKQEILSIVTDNNGNIKWTKNIHLISLQLVKNLNLPNGKLPENLINFLKNWLIKQIQPSCKVYQLMEDNFFKSLLDNLLPNLLKNNLNNDDELNNISNRLLILINFNWNVFGDYYKQDLMI